MGLIRLEFDTGKTKIIAVSLMIASGRFPNKPRLPDRGQIAKAVSTRQAEAAEQPKLLVLPTDLGIAHCRSRG
jgi:hypothetical protein